MSSLFEITNLCRVCSSAGQYDIHCPIPCYMYNTSHEIWFFNKNIATLMQEVTGFEITKDDGLPQKICTICTSYLIHAVNFRQQLLTNNNRIRTSTSTKGTDLQLADTSAISGKLYPANETNVSKATYENLKAELDQFFLDNNDLNTDNESDKANEKEDKTDKDSKLTKTEATKTALHNFFNYNEKIFEEDDCGDLGEIEINQPDGYEERKCPACNCLFMLLDSYESHMKECIQAKLVNFIIHSHKLLIIKKHKAISAVEFMRRMIFSLKTIVKSLALSYRVITKNKPKINDTNPDVVKNENITVKLNQLLFYAPINMMISSKPPSQIKPLIHPSPLAIALRDSLRDKMISSTPKTSKIYYAAKCGTCRIKFNAIDELEKHNRQKHNTQQKQSSSTTSNRSSEQENHLLLMGIDDYSQEGIVDVLKLRQRSPNVVNIELNSND